MQDPSWSDSSTWFAKFSVEFKKPKESDPSAMLSYFYHEERVLEIIEEQDLLRFSLLIEFAYIRREFIHTNTYT